SLAVATGHEDIAKAGSSVNWGAIAQATDTLVVLMGMKKLGDITRELLVAGREPTTPAAVIRWGTTGLQQVMASDLAHIADEAARSGFAPPAVLVVGAVVAMRERLAWFDQRPLRG
ncbi:MAG: HemD protein, partial [Gemmatimonadales bacterium]|nr:HemD protein [Gemmatimonadales bacterium]